MDPSSQQQYPAYQSFGDSAAGQGGGAAPQQQYTQEQINQQWQAYYAQQVRYGFLFALFVD